MHEGTPFLAWVASSTWKKKKKKGERRGEKERSGLFSHRCFSFGLFNPFSHAYRLLMHERGEGKRKREGGVGAPPQPHILYGGNEEKKEKKKEKKKKRCGRSPTRTAIPSPPYTPFPAYTISSIGKKKKEKGGGEKKNKSSRNRGPSSPEAPTPNVCDLLEQPPPTNFFYGKGKKEERKKVVITSLNPAATPSTLGPSLELTSYFPLREKKRREGRDEKGEWAGHVGSSRRQGSPHR